MAAQETRMVSKFLRDRPDDSWQFDVASQHNNAYGTLDKAFSMDPDAVVEEVECIAHCDRAPALQINYDFHGPLSVDDAADLIEQYKSGAVPARTISGTRLGAVVGSDG